MMKSTPGGGKSNAERELAIQQIVNRAVVSTNIVDIMKAAGIDTPDISILPDDFLAEVREMDKKNLAWRPCANMSIRRIFRMLWCRQFPGRPRRSRRNGLCDGCKGRTG